MLKMRHRQQGLRPLHRYRQESFALLVDSYPASAYDLLLLENQLRQRQLQLGMDQLQHLHHLIRGMRSNPLEIFVDPLQLRLNELLHQQLLVLQLH